MNAFSLFARISRPPPGRSTDSPVRSEPRLQLSPTVFLCAPDIPKVLPTGMSAPRWLCTALLLLVAASTASAANPPATATTRATNSPAFAPSSFVMPKSTAQGRDPFFPNSARPFGVATVTRTPTNTIPVAPSELFLRGFSGVPSQRLAIINNHTFSQGEEAEILAAGKRIKIKCVEISTNFVTVEIGGELRELHLHSGP